MSKIRVFELAKELNISAKQLILQVKGIGISVENSFNILADDQVIIIRKTFSGGSEAVSDDATEAAKKVRKRISTRVSEDLSSEIILSPPLVQLDPKHSANEKIARRVRKSSRPLGTLDGTQDSYLEEVISGAAHEEPLPFIPVSIFPDPIIESVVEVSIPEIEPPVIDVPPVVIEIAPAMVKEKVVMKETEPAPLIVTAFSMGNGLSTSLSKEEESKKRLKKEVLPPEKDPLALGFKKSLPPKGIRTIEKEGFVSKKQSHRNIKMFNSEPEVVTAWNRGARGFKGKTEKIEKQKHQFEPRKKGLTIGGAISVSELASLIGIKASEIIKKLMTIGVMATVNQPVSAETALLIAGEFQINLELESEDLEDRLDVKLKEEVFVEGELRPPVVTIMGHVDHGKTSLLDKIRSSRIASGEAGGITQHIGAYHVETGVGKITFLDTPGHEAFTAMRARGATITDIVVLVVAADDGIQPQTIEAIHHAQAAAVPIIVAVNKIDRPGADPDRIQQGLLSHNLVSEAFGGETIFVNVSAKTGEGIPQLLEMIQLQADVLELKAPLKGAAVGVVIESRMAKGQGPVGTVLIQKGVLEPGGYYLVGDTFGKVRALVDDQGRRIKQATPSIPVEVLGFNAIPEIGEKFIVVADEKTAREIAELRSLRKKEEVESKRRKTHLENLFSKVDDGEKVQLTLLIKADVQGSAEALESALVQLNKENVSVRCIHAAVGNITETDVLLASASDAVIIGFNVKPEVKARDLGNREGIDIRLYSIIYDAIDDVTKSMVGLLKPVFKEEIIGHAEIRKLYQTSKGSVLGCYVTDGRLVRGALVRIMRKETVVHQSTITSLKRFKDDVREVLTNYECGVIVHCPEPQEGDTLEAYFQTEAKG